MRVLYLISFLIIQKKMSALEYGLMIVMVLAVLYIIYILISNSKTDAMESSWMEYTHGSLQNPYDFVDPSGNHIGLYDYVSPNVSGRHVYYSSQDLLPGAYKNCKCGCTEHGVHNGKPVNVNNVADNAIVLPPVAEQAIVTEMKEAEKQAKAMGKSDKEVKEDVKLAKVITETEIAKEIVEHMGSSPSDYTAMSVAVHTPAARARKMWIDYMMLRNPNRRYSYIPNGGTTRISPRRNVSYQSEFPTIISTLEDSMPYSAPYSAPYSKCSLKPAMAEYPTSVSQPGSVDITTPTNPNEEESSVVVDEPIADSIKNELIVPDDPKEMKENAKERFIDPLGNVNPSRRGLGRLGCTTATVYGKANRTCGGLPATNMRLAELLQENTKKDINYVAQATQLSEKRVENEMRQQGYSTDSVKQPSNLSMDNRKVRSQNFKQQEPVQAPPRNVVFTK